MFQFGGLFCRNKTQTHHVRVYVVIYSLRPKKLVTQMDVSSIKLVLDTFKFGTRFSGRREYLVSDDFDLSELDRTLP